jgi:putative ABC transport system permease protein
VIVIGIAGVVGVLVAMLAMGAGFSRPRSSSTGSEDSAIILRGGSQAETNSNIGRDQVPLIAGLAGIAKGKPTGAHWSRPKLSQIVEPAKARATGDRCQRADSRRQRRKPGSCGRR